MISYEAQKIRLDGVVNARQLGGYTVSSGKKIKNNVLLRSGALFGIKEPSQLSGEYRVGDIVDFRMDQETAVMPDPAVNGANYHHISVINDIPMTEENFKLYKELLKCKDTYAKYKTMCDAGIDLFPDQIYRSLVFSDEGKAGYRKFFDILLNKNENSAVLFHCTQGKDRTGMAAILVLSALGADRETVTEDYLMTNIACGDILDKIKSEIMNVGEDKKVLDFALFLESVDKRLVEPIFDTMDKEYGSVKGYLKTELGLTETDFDRLEELYLE